MTKLNCALAAVLLFSASMVFSGFPPRTECSNLNATIKINVSEQSVSILTTMYPEATYENFDLSELNLSESLVQKMPEQQRDKTKRTVSFKEISLSKKDGSEMPDAYNRLAETSGSLIDYFVCSTSLVRM